METGLAELAEAACHVTTRNSTPRAHINARDDDVGRGKADPTGDGQRMEAVLQTGWLQNGYHVDRRAPGSALRREHRVRWVSREGEWGQGPFQSRETHSAEPPGGGWRLGAGHGTSCEEALRTASWSGVCCG